MSRPISRLELVRRLRRLGFEGPFSGGKHSFMRKGDLKLRIPNPHGEDVGVALLKEILKQACITDEQWRGTE